MVDADGYIIKNVILNWDDEAATVILKNCLQAMKTTSSNHAKQKINPRLLIIDTIMPETDERFIGKFTDVLMLAVTHKGRIRTEKEFRNLLDGSGFDIINVIRSPDPVHFVSIIEAIPTNHHYTT
jgi:O-methyltransferase